MGRRLLLLTVCAVVAPASGGVIVNAGFETGDLSGWQSTGDAGTVSTLYAEQAAGGDYQALLTTNAGSVLQADLESFLGLPAGRLDAIADATDAFEGSAIRQSFHVAAGDVLRFAWNFLTNETPGGNWNDFAFWSLVGEHDALLVADTFDYDFGVSMSGFSSETGLRTTTYTVQTTGVVTLGFGVVDAMDAGFTSALLVDEVTLTPASAVVASTPEPGSLVLLGLSAAGLAAGRRRRRK